MDRSTFRVLPVVAALALGSGWAAAATDTTAAPATAAKTTSNAGQKLSRGDKEFIEDAAKGGMFEVQAGQLAAKQGGDAQVKELGNRLVQDHGKANDELAQIAQSKGVKLPEKDKWTDKREVDKLAKLSGDKFDREFAEHAVKDHEKDIKKFEKASSKLDDPDLKSWASKQLPVLREHLAMAQKLSESGQQNAANTRKAPDTRAAGNKGTKY